jgi:bifunctional non-homologous end joining protein LigD
MALRNPKLQAPFPGFIRPAPATKVSKPPAGDAWIHEIKFDGYRAQVHLHNEAIRILTRRGVDWSKQFKKIADHAWLIKARSAIIDGEIVVQAASGLSDFCMLQSAMRSKQPSDKLVMYTFDLLYLNGMDMRSLPLIERKAELRTSSRLQQLDAADAQHQGRENRSYHDSNHQDEFRPLVHAIRQLDGRHDKA